MPETRLHVVQHVPISAAGCICTVPNNAKPLTVKVIGTKPYLFLEFDPNGMMTEKYYKLVTTGQAFTSGTSVKPPEYVESFVIQTSDGTHVFHLFEFFEKFIVAPPEGSH